MERKERVVESSNVSGYRGLDGVEVVVDTFLILLRGLVSTNFFSVVVVVIDAISFVSIGMGSIRTGVDFE